MGNQTPNEMTVIRASSLIGQAFDRYRALVIPADASAVQIRETRNAFYAGASTVIEAVLVLGEGDIAEDVGVSRLEALRLELEAFAASLMQR